MLDRPFLLTYQLDGNATFDWYGTEDEMREAIAGLGLKDDDIFEIVEVLNRREVTL